MCGLSVLWHRMISPGGLSEFLHQMKKSVRLGSALTISGIRLSLRAALYEFCLGVT